MQAFPDKFRLSTEDEHASNGLALWALYELFPDMFPVRNLCDTHKAHKVCELVWSSNGSDMRGLLAATMFHQFCDGARNWKNGAKEWIRATLKVRPMSEAPAHAPEHFAAMLGAFSYADNARASGARARLRHQNLRRRRRLLNGDYTVLLETQHYCRGWGPEAKCCRNDTHTYQQLCALIDAEERPDSFAGNRWIGSEHSQHWHSLWLSTHAIYPAAIAIGFLGMNVYCDRGKINEYVWSSLCPEVHLERPAVFADVKSEDDGFTRQSTYGANASAWLQTQPLPRLWHLCGTIGAQQELMRDLLKTAGGAWDAEQLYIASQGGERKYRGLLAAQEVFPKKALRNLGELLMNQGALKMHMLPLAYQTHDLAMVQFRMMSRCCCAIYQLVSLRHKKYPYKGLLTLTGTDDERLAAAEAICADYHYRPCVMDPWTFHLVQRAGASPAQFLNATVQATQLFLARLCENTNASVEASNAAIRSNVVAQLQCPARSIQDVCASWILRWARHQKHCIFSAEDDTDSDSDGSGSEGDQEVMGGGGGGRCRAFFRRKHREVCPDGVPMDLALLHALYHDECVNRNGSQLLRECEEEGRSAREAKRRAFVSGQQSDTTNFGTIKKCVRDKQATEAGDRALLAEYDMRMQSLPALEDVNAGALALYSEDPLRAVSDVIATHAGEGVDDQVRTFDKLSALVVRREKRVAREERNKLKSFIDEATSVAGLPLAKLEMPRFGKLKIVRGEQTVLRWQDQLHLVAAKKVAEMNKKREPVAQLLLDDWDLRLRVARRDDWAPIGDVSEAAKPTHCFKVGGTTCLCS